jgi:hypothetical protein
MQETTDDNVRKFLTEMIQPATNYFSHADINHSVVEHLAKEHATDRPYETKGEFSQRAHEIYFSTKKESINALLYAHTNQSVVAQRPSGKIDSADTTYHISNKRKTYLMNLQMHLLRIRKHQK